MAPGALNWIPLPAVIAPSVPRSTAGGEPWNSGAKGEPKGELVHCELAGNSVAAGANAVSSKDGGAN